MARPKKETQSESLRVVTVKLTPALEKTLHQISQEASDRLGWTVSSSAVLRALVKYAGQQPMAWATSTLHPVIEQEIAAGRVWGRKKQGS